jgi:uncharacterized protein (DUF302 family)
MEGFGIRRVVGLSFEEALAKAPEALKSEGFGILTEIDVKETLKKKLDVDFRRYRILGACHPPSAHKALSLNLEVGLAMPCNVIVFEGDDGKTVVEAVDPTKTMAAAGGPPEMKALAESVRDRLSKALDRIG